MLDFYPCSNNFKGSMKLLMMLWGFTAVSVQKAVSKMFNNSPERSNSWSYYSRQFTKDEDLEAGQRGDRNLPEQMKPRVIYKNSKMRGAKVFPTLERYFGWSQKRIMNINLKYIDI